METTILITPRLDVKVNIQKLKEDIHRYVGDRMIKEEPTEMPGLTLNNQLEDEDKKAITKINGDCGFIFIEHDEDSALCDDYLTVKL